MADTTVHHVGITVTDIDEAVEFYRDTFDFDVLDTFSVSGEGFETGVGVPDATAEFAHLDGDGTRLELVSYEPAGADLDPADVNDAGAKHLAVGVDDLAGFYESLPDDVETLSEPQTTESGSRILFVRDPEANLVEVIEA